MIHWILTGVLVVLWWNMLKLVWRTIKDPKAVDAKLSLAVLVVQLYWHSLPLLCKAAAHLLRGQPAVVIIDLRLSCKGEVYDLYGEFRDVRDEMIRIAK